MPFVHRRYFLLGALAAPVTQKLRAQPASLGVAMIGVGNRGSYVMQSVMKVPGARVAALCDLKPDRLDKAASAAARDNPKTFREFREAIAHSGVDIVHISTPCDLHVDMAIAALEAGKHVYCEKPVGIEPKSIERLVKAVKKSGKVFQVGQQLRSSKKLKTSIGRIHDGICGRVVMIKAQRHSSDDLDHNGPSADWFFDAKRSGDVIVEMSVHNLDACNWVAQSRPDAAAGFGGALVWKNDPPGRTNMDGYTLSYDYANGVKLSFTQVFFHARGMPGSGQYWYVYGTDGSVDLQTATFYPRAGGASPTVLADATAREALDLDHVTAFFAAIRDGGSNPANIDVGATGALTAILGRDAIYKQRLLRWSDFGISL